jgi:hypothetical protein
MKSAVSCKAMLVDLVDPSLIGKQPSAEDIRWMPPGAGA